jgi:DNA-binding NarL/FixJ family response regulator
MRGTKIRILINEDQDIYREGILQIIRSDPDFMPVETIDAEQDLLKAVEDKRPDVVITSIQNTNIDVLEVTKTISESFPDVGVLAISMFTHARIIISIVQAGAKGCLLRNANKSELVHAIRTIYKLEQYYSMEIRGMIGSMVAKKDFKSHMLKDYDLLTDKDKLFLRLLCQEFSLKDISARLNVTVRTLEHRKHKLYQMLNKENTIGLLNYAIVNGIYNPFEPANH